MRDMTREERNEILLRHGVIDRQEAERFPDQPAMSRELVARRLRALDLVVERAKEAVQALNTAAEVMGEFVEEHFDMQERKDDAEKTAYMLHVSIQALESEVAGGR